MWNKIMSYRNFNRFMFKLVSKTLPIRHHLTKITLQLVHKTVLHWLPWILSPFPNPFLTSVLCRLSCDLLQNLSAIWVIIPIFPLFLAFFNVLTTDLILFQFMRLQHAGNIYECSKWEFTFSQAAAEKILIFLGHSDFLYTMSPLD